MLRDFILTIHILTKAMICFLDFRKLRIVFNLINFSEVAVNFTNDYYIDITSFINL